MRKKSAITKNLMRICVIQYEKNLKTKPYLGVNTRKLLTVFDFKPR